MKPSHTVAPVICAVTMLLGFTPVDVNARMLSGDEIRSLITGRTIALNTPVGALPLKYDASGSVTGDLTGLSVARLFAPSESGKWWIAGNSMCQQWPTWYDGRRFCFRIEQLEGRSIRWLRDDGEVGTAMVRG